MPEKYSVILNREDVQVLDALTERLEVWRNTAAYLREESLATDVSVLADCCNPVEADLVVQHYVDVIARIASQVS